MAITSRYILLGVLVAFAPWVVAHADDDGEQLHNPAAQWVDTSSSLSGYKLQYIDKYDDINSEELSEWQTDLQPLSDTRDRHVQKASFLGTWIPSANEFDLGFTDVEASIELTIPLPYSESPLQITPHFSVHYFDVPQSQITTFSSGRGNFWPLSIMDNDVGIEFDTPRSSLSPFFFTSGFILLGFNVPERTYDAAIEWRHQRQLNEKWHADVAVTTGYYTDFSSSNSDAFRVIGRGIASYDWSPEIKLILGVAYLNRSSVRILPVGGLLLTPDESTRLELVVPRPRVAWRLDNHSTPVKDELWFYVAGEYGGGVWAMQRATNHDVVRDANDVIEYSDFRILLGLERNQQGTLSSRIELGYVFEREIEFHSISFLGKFKLDNTLFLRYGVSY